MDSFKNIIQNLKELPLSDFPIESIKNHLKELGGFGATAIILPIGKIIVRARLNKPYETFDSVAELSFKPSICNTSFQRASTPKNTMFYGCIIPNEAIMEDRLMANITAFYETSNMVRNKIENGEEKLTLCRWKVTKDIPLIAIVYHKDFINNSAITKELFEAYQKSLIQYNNEQDIIRYNTITEYLASEFAKTETPNEYDYLISALFTEMILLKNFAGVYYPSSRTEGKGFNVVIQPKVVENFMIPIDASEYTVYRKDGAIYFDIESIAKIGIGQTKFNYTTVTDPLYHKGRENSYKILSGEIKL